MPTTEERFVAKIQVGEDGCWLWTGAIAGTGYGLFWDGERLVSAHRHAWTMYVETIPPGMHVDHLCFTRACVNPGHLRLVTAKQNQEHRKGANRNNRSSGVRGVSWCKAKKKWHVAITHHRRTINGGYYADLTEAEAAVMALRAQHYTHSIEGAA